ncbi:hypothetical protein F8M41_010513 [Gigaspora margarita]|uniref:Uncharacterized protein n=1 Tax=Gigaspora margarita TaxID=4874 RepID=A0A8H3X2A6_GIGMA|nr:hypothetical protein F8M41_010513 [Gigaspora margarita]
METGIVFPHVEPRNKIKKPRDRHYLPYYKLSVEGSDLSNFNYLEIENWISSFEYTPDLFIKEVDLTRALQASQHQQTPQQQLTPQQQRTLQKQRISQQQ